MTEDLRFLGWRSSKAGSWKPFLRQIKVIGPNSWANFIGFGGAFYGIVGLRAGVDAEALTFAATLRSSKISRILSEEVSVDRLRKEVDTNVAKAIEISNWLLKVVTAVNRLQEEMRQVVTKIRPLTVACGRNHVARFYRRRGKKTSGSMGKNVFPYFWFMS